jgi:hypothetical protein
LKLFRAVLLVLAALPGCGGDSDEDKVKSLVSRTFEVINEGSSAGLWDTLCPSLQTLIPRATYEAGFQTLYEAGEVHATGLRFHYVNLDGDAGEVRYDIDLVAAGNTTHRTETYKVRKLEGNWCFEWLVSRE